MFFLGELLLADTVVMAAVILFFLFFFFSFSFFLFDFFICCCYCCCCCCCCASSFLLLHLFSGFFSFPGITPLKGCPHILPIRLQQVTQNVNWLAGLTLAQVRGFHADATQYLDPDFVFFLHKNLFVYLCHVIHSLILFFIFLADK